MIPESLTKALVLDSRCGLAFPLCVSLPSTLSDVPSDVWDRTMRHANANPLVATYIGALFPHMNLFLDKFGNGKTLDVERVRTAFMKDTIEVRIIVNGLLCAFICAMQAISTKYVDCDFTVQACIDKTAFFLSCISGNGGDAALLKTFLTKRNILCYNNPHDCYDGVLNHYISYVPLFFSHKVPTSVCAVLALDSATVV